ncbi:MAG: DUF4124 domain-containing protein [Burkholderiaceae bacterium]|jgi:hypothetical protein|nr:DUF4124 domain-containing protein [Burkholderiaceae bacterium]
MTTLHALLFGLAVTASASAWAQYSWVDNNGRRVFSDQPPPADVPPQNVRSQPHGRPAPAVVREVSASSASAARPTAAASAPAGIDQALEEKKKQAQADEAARNKAEQLRRAEVRADNCKRAMNYKSSLDSGQRIARMNDKTGEREILDDAQRAAELARVQKAVAANCN